MKTLEKILDIIEENDISIDEYTENDKLCGYELNTYTNGGVNQIIFLDFRDTDLDPKNEEDFIKVFSDRIDSIDIDDEIETNRLNECYKATFTLKQSLSDFTAWKKGLDKLVKTIKN